MLPICRTLPDGRVAVVAYAESYEYTATRMGESYISLNMESPVYLDFALGDFVDFRDERFHLDYTPTVEKVSSSRSYGGAFSYRNVKFSGCTNDLVNARFLDVVDGDNHIHYSGLAKFSFFCATIEDFISRLQANLNRIYPEQWVVRAAPTSMYATNVSVEIDNKNIWEALEVLSTKFKTSFVVREFLENVLDSHGQKIPLLDVHGRPYVPARYKTARKKHLIIGEEADISGYQLQYGKGNGFVSLERSTESEQQIITRLRAYGSTKNLPALYYSTAYDPEFHVYGKDSAAMLGYKMAKTIDSDIDKGDIKIFLQFNALAYFSERESLPFEVVHDGVVEGVSGHFVKNIQGNRKFTRYAVKGNDSDNTLKTKEFTYDSKEDLIQGLQKEGNAYVSKDTKNAYILCLQERKGIDWNTPAPAPIVKVLPNHEHYSKVSAIVAREIKPSGDMQPYYEPVLKSYVFTQIVGRVTSTEIVVHYDINPDFPVASYPNILVLAGLNLSQKQSLLAHLKKGDTYLCFHDNRFKKVLSHLKAYWYPRYPVTPDNMAVHNLMLPSFLRYVVNINGKEIEIDPKQTDIVSYDQHGRIATFRYPKKSGLVYAADKLVLDPYIQDDEAVAKYGVREGCKYFDTEGDEDGGEIYPTIQGLKSNDAFAAGYNPKLASGDNGFLDEVLVGGVQFYDKDGRVTHMIEDEMLPLQDDGIVRNEMAGEKREAVNDTFYVYLKDMGFDLRDAVNGENTSVKMTSGACGEREFALLQQSGNPSKVSLWKRGDGTFSTKKEDGAVEVSAWRMSLKRSYDETLKMWFPNKNYPISGTPEVSHRAEDGDDTHVRHTDSFVLLGFDLPRMFIDAAAVRLENAAREFLQRNGQPKYTYTPKFDPVFMEHDLALRGENSLHYQLRAGMILRFQDRDLRVANRPKGASVQSGMEAVTLFIDTLNIKMSENGHLEYGVTLKEETEVSTLQKIQHQITNLQSESNSAVTPPRARALSLTATQGHYLQKRVPDTALGHITFDDGMTSRELARLKKGFVIGEDVVDEDANMLNSSVYYVDEYGQAHFRNLKIDEHLEVPELRYNRTSVHIGYTLQSPAAGVVLRVEQTDTNSGKVFLKLEEGELGTVEVGDLLTGIFHATTAQGGATADKDDGKLNLTFAGFATAYFEVTAVDAGRQWFTYVLRQGTSFHPQAHMTFASRGSRTYPERRNFVVYTRSYTRYLRGVADWEIQAEHVAMQQGELDNLHKLGFSKEIKGIGMFADNVFLTGKLLIDNKLRDVGEVVNELDKKITEQTVYLQYSVDGVNAWHDAATSADRFMRQRKGNGAWSAALPFGRDGAKGDPGTPGRDGQDGRPGKDGADGRSSYTHVRYSADGGQTFTAATAEALEAAKKLRGVGLNLASTLHPAVDHIRPWRPNFGPQTSILPESELPSGAFRGLKVVQTKANHGIFHFNDIGYPRDRHYTMSFWAKADAARVLNFGPELYGANGLIWKSVTLTTEWKFYQHTFFIAASTEVKCPLVLYGWTEGTFYYADVKFEEGSTPTPWTPCALDAAAGTTPARYRGEWVSDQPVASINPRVYTWVDAKGEKGDPGNGVESIVSEFAVNTSPTSAPTSGWSAVPPQWSLGKFLWTRSRIVYTDGRVVTTVPQCDSSWQAVDGVHFSDENLILGGGEAYTSREYLVRSYPLTTSGRQLKDGEEVTILIKGSLGNRPTARWMVYNSGGWISVYNYFNRGEDKSGLWMLTLPWRTRQDTNTPNPNTSFELYAFPNTSNEEVQVEWVKMVRGNKTTQAFTSSAEELSAKAQAAHHRANEAYEKAVADHKITEAEQRAIVGARAAALLAQVEEEARRIEVERNAAAVRLLGDRTDYDHLNHLNINFKAAKNALVGALKNYVAIGLTNPENFTTAKFEAAVLTQRAAYEEARTAITEALGELGNDVGGRNLFGFQKGIWMERAGEGFTAEFAPDIKGIRLRCIEAIGPSVSAGIRMRHLGFGRAGFYTVSFLLRGKAKVNVDICDAGDTQATATAAGTLVKVTAQVTNYYQTDSYNGFVDVLNVAGQTINVDDTIELCNLMIERGRVASAWCKAEEDAMWELHNVDYLRKAFAQPSGLDGGIVFGALLQMRDTNGQVTGYFNGLRSQNGAQYQRPALALGVENFNAAGEREVTAFHFDGSGHIGKMNVRTDGSIFIPPGSANGAPISNALPMEFSPVPLDVPALLKSTYFETRLSWQASSATVSGDAKGNVSQRIDLGTLSVERDYGALQGKLKVSVRATTKWLIDDLNPISPKHGGGVLDPSKEVRWDVRLMLTNDSDAFYTLFYAEGRSLAVAQEHPQTLNLPNMRTGAYKLVAYIQGEYADTLELNVVQDEPVKYVSTNDAPFNAVRSNGFVSYKNPNQHVYIQDGVLHVNGAPDMSGVLVAGTASGIDGSPLDYWGCKGNFDAQTAREAVGIYRINHYINHIGYSVMITPIHSGRNLVATILRKEKRYVQFVIREAHTAAQVDADFDFTILGRN